MLAALPLLFVPISLVLRYALHAGPVPVFVAAALGTAALAEWLRRATDQVAAHVGPALGGLLTVSFGSVAELVLALFVLADGGAEVVRGQITGSIIGTLLLGLGIAVLVGGAGRHKQQFGRAQAGLLGSLLIIAVIGLLLPAAFAVAGRGLPLQAHRPRVSEEALSLGIACVLLVLYAGNLAYTLVTHRDVFSRGEPENEAKWSLARSLGVMLAATAAVAWDAELVSGALEATAGALHLAPVFLGVVVLALVGTSSDLFAAASFARRDRMEIVLSLCIGSAIQMALVVAPLLVILSWLIGHPMTLVFGLLDLFAIGAAVLIVNSIASDGETTWFEGLLLVGVYALLALGFFFGA